MNTTSRIKIGNLDFNGYVYIPPMAGYTDYVYRTLCYEYDPDVLMSTEMLSSKALMFQETCTKMFLGEEEKQRNLTGIQLFGHEPDIMYKAAKMSEEAGASFVDINMGCPVAKITKGMDGAGLMRHPELALEIVKSVIKATKLPVTVKTRLGWCYDSLNAADLAKSFEDAGVVAMTIHGRTRSQKYQGSARWDLIKDVVDAVDIPIFANGDIKTLEDVDEVLQTTGAAGVAIARGTMGKPWFSKQVNHYLKTGEKLPEPDSMEKFDLALKHTKMLIDYRGQRLGARESRKHVVNYTTGVPGSAKLRGRLSMLDSYEAAEEIIAELKENYLKHSQKLEAVAA